jgi:hypothetical protein
MHPDNRSPELVPIPTLGTSTPRTAPGATSPLPTPPPRVRLPRSRSTRSEQPSYGLAGVRGRIVLGDVGYVLAIQPDLRAGLLSTQGS